MRRHAARPFPRGALAIVALALVLGGPPATHAAGPPAGRLSLLREGTMLDRARGRVEPLPEGGWRFVPEARGTGGLERELVFLPNPVLEELLRIVRADPSAAGRVEVSGEVFVCYGRNWLLASLALPVAPPRTAEAPPAAPKPAAGDEEAIADEFERRLAGALGDVPVTLAPAPEPGPSPSLPSGTQLQSRRGRLVRDTATGGHRFVLVHQREAEPIASVVVLPCRLLEHAERTLRRRDPDAIIVASGTLLAFEGRMYLLPTAMRFANEGRGLDP